MTFKTRRKCLNFKQIMCMSVLLTYIKLECVIINKVNCSIKRMQIILQSCKMQARLNKKTLNVIYDKNIKSYFLLEIRFMQVF